MKLFTKAMMWKMVMMKKGRKKSMMTTNALLEWTRGGMCKQSLSRHLWRENHKWTILRLSVVFCSPYIPKVHGLCVEHSSRVINSHPMAIICMGGPCTNGIISDVVHGLCIEHSSRVINSHPITTILHRSPHFVNTYLYIL
jgi:hypothetical protein